MNIMKWFTRKQKNGNAEPASTEINLDQLESENPNVLEDLFVDHEPPQDERRSDASKDSKIDIQVFLDQDFLTQGFRDGYDYHSSETLTQQIKCIKTEFRIRLDLLIDLKRRKILQLQNQQFEVDGMSDRLNRQIDLFIKDLSQITDRLEKEKEHSAVDEGWIMKAINNYKSGFNRGLELYQEERLLGFNTGMFN